MPTLSEQARWEAGGMDGIVIVTDCDPNPEDADKPWDGAQVAWRIHGGSRAVVRIDVP